MLPIAILLTLASFVVVTILGLLIAKSRKHNSQNPVLIPILYATWIILLCAGMFAFYKASQIVFYIIIAVIALLVIRYIRRRASFRKINLFLKIFDTIHEIQPDLNEHEHSKLTVEVYWRLKKFSDLFVIKNMYHLTHRAYPPVPLTVESTIFSLFRSQTMHAELQKNPQMDVWAKTIETLSEIKSYKESYLSQPVFWKRRNLLETRRIRKTIRETLSSNHKQDPVLFTLVKAYQSLGEKLFDSIFQQYTKITEDKSIPDNLAGIWTELHADFVDDVVKHTGLYSEKLNSGLAPITVVLTFIRVSFRNNLKSGRYHLYRGLLSPEGRGMCYLHRNVLTLALDEGIITKEELSEELRQTEYDIKILG